MRSDTVAVRAGREDCERLGVHAPPLDLSTTYPIRDLEAGGLSLDAMVGGGRPTGSAVYARLHNPTVARFEEALARLEAGDDAVAFASGMAAMTAAVLAAGVEGRRHVVAVRPLYGGTDHLLESGLLGSEVSWTDAAGVGRAIRDDTGLVVIETPANPTLTLIDIAAVVREAGEVPVLVDSTFATPVLQRPLECGATMVLHSATKFLGGHGDVMGGVVATMGDWAGRLRQVRMVTGAVLHPLAGYLLHRGLTTLPVRVRAQQAAAGKLARWLNRHPAVHQVYYPGLPGGDPEALIGRQMVGPGSLIAFRVTGGLEAARRVMAEVRIIVPAVSLGSVDSLIQHPAGMTHRIVDAEARESSGVSDDLLRLSVGLEAWEDLREDLARALAAAGVARPAGVDKGWWTAKGPERERARVS